MVTKVTFPIDPWLLSGQALFSWVLLWVWFVQLGMLGAMG